MANFIEKLGLDFLVEDEEQVRALWGYIAQEGKAIVGYYGFPYLNQHFGDAQLILRTIRNDEEKRIEVVGMDTHSSGNCVWEVRLSGMNISRKEADVMERRCVAHRKNDGGGMAVINIVNADVLPSFDEGEEVKLQMIAFPSLIEYFKDEDEYAAAQPDWRDGKLLLADGTMMPTGLMRNHDPESDKFEEDEDLDDLMLIRGTVKALYHGVFELGGERHNAYLRCIIGTEHGDLEIIHTIDEVKEEQRTNIRVGAVVNGVFTLSGDAAIYEYDHGIVLDEAHDLSILRSTFAGGDPERVRFVFAEDATYLAEYNNVTYTGRDAIIDRLKYVAEAADDKYFAYLATISSVDDGDESLPYGAGRRCIVLASGEEDHYESIAFVDINENGRISKLLTSTNSRYHFRIDEKPKPKTPLDDIELPESVIEPIVLRARFHGIIGEGVTDENILRELDDARMYENNVHQMLSTLPHGDERTNLENLFGYLFAKAIETEYSEKHRVGLFKKRLIVSYTPGDAWGGRINTLLKPEQNERIVAAMKLGKQFAKDFALFHPFDEPHNDVYDADLLKALMIVQQLGKLYEPKCMN